MRKFKVGDDVRVLKTDWPEEMPVGSIQKVKRVGLGGGVGLEWTCDDGSIGDLFFRDDELELAPKFATDAADLDAIIVKLERTKELREELGLVAP